MSGAASVCSPSVLQEPIQNSPTDYRKHNSDQRGLSATYEHVQEVPDDDNVARATAWAPAQKQQAVRWVSGKKSDVTGVATMPLRLSRLQEGDALSTIVDDSCILPFFDEEESGVEAISAVDDVTR